MLTALRTRGTLTSADCRADRRYQNTYLFSLCVFFINARELGQAQEVLSELENLEWGRMFNERLDAVVWPPKVKRVRDVCRAEGKAPHTCRTIPSLSKGGGGAQKGRHAPNPLPRLATTRRRGEWGRKSRPANHRPCFFGCTLHLKRPRSRTPLPITPQQGLCPPSVPLITRTCSLFLCPCPVKISWCSTSTLISLSAGFSGLHCCRSSSEWDRQPLELCPY